MRYRVESLMNSAGPCGDNSKFEEQGKRKVNMDQNDLTKRIGL